MRAVTYALTTSAILAVSALAGVGLGVGSSYTVDKFVSTFVSPNQKIIASK